MEGGHVVDLHGMKIKLSAKIESEIFKSERKFSVSAGLVKIKWVNLINRFDN